MKWGKRSLVNNDARIKGWTDKKDKKKQKQNKKHTSF